jgi:hypothetical protein
MSDDALVRASPDGQSFEMRFPRGVVRVPKMARAQKSNFMKRFNAIWVVQSLREKYSALHGPQISGFLCSSRTHKRGASRSSRTLGAGCDGRGTSRDE